MEAVSVHASRQHPLPFHATRVQSVAMAFMPYYSSFFLSPWGQGEWGKAFLAGAAASCFNFIIEILKSKLLLIRARVFCPHVFLCIMCKYFQKRALTSWNWRCMYDELPCVPWQLSLGPLEEQPVPSLLSHLPNSI